MTDAETLPETGKKSRNILIAAGGTLLVALVAGFLIYSSICPCERTPGGFLFGERASEPVNDWSFANDVPLCQLQIWAGIRPHAINLNCMSTPEGELYLSCSVCTSKYWAAKVGEDETGVMRLNGVVYPVVVNRETDSAAMDRAWAARITKLQIHGGGPSNPKPPSDAERPDHWWTFRIVSSR
jgi:LPXTG-motif cell wall-anchored protein